MISLPNWIGHQSTKLDRVGSTPTDITLISKSLPEETMLLIFRKPFDRVLKVHSRRGQHAFRERYIPAETSQYEFPALENSIVEILDGEMIYAKVPESRCKGQVHVEKFATVDGREIEPRLAKADTDDLQSVGGVLRPHGETVPGTNVVQVSPVDAGNARLGLAEERGPEGSTDGVHRVDDEPSVLHDRRPEGISAVPAPVKDAGRDRLLGDEIRSSVGAVPVSGQPVLGREEHGNKEVGVSHPVYPRFKLS